MSHIAILVCIIVYDWINNDLQLNERITAYVASSLFVLVIIIHTATLIKGDAYLEWWQNSSELLETTG